MDNLKCPDCNSEVFMQLIAFPIDKDNPEIIFVPKGIKCIKCGKILSTDEVKKILR